MSSETTPTLTQVPAGDQPVIANDSAPKSDRPNRSGRGGHGRGGRNGHGRGGRRHNNDEDRPDLTEEQKQKIQARKNINKTFDKKVNTKFAKFMPLRRFQNAASANNISVTINKGENKVKIQAVIVMSDIAKNKTTIRKESTIIDEIHTLPPYIKNKNLAEKITAKFYKGQGVILNLPEREGRKHRQEKDQKNKKNNEDDQEIEAEIEETQNDNAENQAEESSSQSRFQEVDISHILEAAVDLPVKFE